MKKLLLFIAIFTISFCYSQGMTKEYLEGTWIPTSYACELTFSGTNRLSFNIEVVTNDKHREKLKVTSYMFDGNVFYIETLYKPTNYRCVGRLVAIDKNTMVAEYTSDDSAIVIYKREL